MTPNLPEKPPAVVLQERLQGIQRTLEALNATVVTIGQQQQEQAGLLTECQRVLAVLSQPPPRIPWWQRWQVWCGVAAVGLSLLWQVVTWTEQRVYQRTQHAQALAAIHGVLDKHYKELPPSVQAAVLEAYNRYGLRAPGQPPGGRK